MEAVLDLYHEPYDPSCPVVCLDERPCQLIKHVRTPQPMRAACGAKPARPAREDYEYERCGTTNVFLAVEPLTGVRRVWVRTQRRQIEFAEVVRQLCDEVYSDVERIRLVCDNLNTHTAAAFYVRFDAETARRLARKVEFVHTPKHGSWLNMAEIDLAALSVQCLNRRIDSEAWLDEEVQAWCDERGVPIRWQFTTEEARCKLHRLYPEYPSK
jgi:hypothetical protein